MEFIIGLMLFDIVFNEMFFCVILLIVQEMLLLVQCFGCILVSDVVLLLDVSGFDNFVMDGYAVCLVDIVFG